MPPIQFVVDRRLVGQTLAGTLKMRFGISWAQAKRIVEGGHVKLSGQVERDPARKPKLGKRVEVAAGAIEIKKVTLPSDKKKTTPATPQASKSKSPQAETANAGEARRTAKPKPPAKDKERAAPLLAPECIVYQDDAIVVVNKPAGLTTMRNAEEAAEFGRGQRFLTRTLAGMLPAALGAPNRPVFAVHRLDRDTSGLVVFARTRAAEEGLLRQFRKHTTERRYLALTRGTPPAKRIESVLVRDRGDGRRGSTTDLIADARRGSQGEPAGGSPSQEGKRAVTHVAVLEKFGRFALVECRLETGRTHQVRIHLGEAGAPLCGEEVYDRPIDGKPHADGSGAARPMLHAAKLGFTHPESGDAVNWEAAPPDDFAKLLTRLRGERGA